VGSVSLWVAYFMGLVIFYALINWMPLLFKDAGLAPQTASLISALFPLGGVGAILFGWLMDRFNANVIIAVGFALTAVAVYAIGQTAGNLALLVVVVFVAGTLMNTSQSSLPALAAGFLSYAGACDRRGLDAGPGPLWWRCRLLSRGRARTPATDLLRDLCDRGCPGLDRRSGADGQAARASRRHGGSGGCKERSAGSLKSEDVLRARGSGVDR
jgi:Sugar phosphate permease